MRGVVSNTYIQVFSFCFFFFYIHSFFPKSAWGVWKMASSFSHCTRRRSSIFYLLLLAVLLAQISTSLCAKVQSTARCFRVLIFFSWRSLKVLWLSLFFSVIWVGFQVYMVYMGSKTGEDPDEILKQNHQMLASVHRGRSA